MGRVHTPLACCVFCNQRVLESKSDDGSFIGFPKILSSGMRHQELGCWHRLLSQCGTIITKKALVCDPSSE